MATDGRYAGNAGAFSGVATDGRYAGNAGAFSGVAMDGRYAGKNAFPGMSQQLLPEYRFAPAQMQRANALDVRQINDRSAQILHTEHGSTYS
jgi:hypothetical protein